MINVNGTFQHANRLTNRGLLFGDGVYEQVKYIKGKIIFWEEHYFRLMAAMRIARMHIPDAFTPEFLQQEIIKTVEENRLAQQAVIVRFMVFRLGGMDLTPITNEVCYCVEIQQTTVPFYRNESIPYEVELYKDFFIPANLFSTLQTTNQLVKIMGSIFAQENDYQNCILLNQEKNVVGFLDANIFLVKENTLITPPLSDGAVNGITRKKMIEILRKGKDFLVEEKSITPFELQKSDEIFLTNTLIGLQSVSKYRKKTFENKVGEALVQKLNTATELS